MQTIRTSLFSAALAAAAMAPAPAAASESDEAYVCGTDHSPAALAKLADLPRIPKVYSGKSVAIMVKIAFSDAEYKVTDSTINKTHGTINTLYRAMSRNTFEFEFKIHPEVWVAPGTKASYGSNFNSLQSFISAKLKESGYVKGTNYTVFVASFPQIAVGWGGLSNGPGGGGNYINGSYSAGVTAHELGHAVGLPHAHSIEAGSDIFGTPGTSSQHVEYGNPYDVMGSAGGLGHFNVNYKWRTGWMDKEEALEVKNSGVYRLYAHDNAVHKGRLLGIRVPSSDTRYAYWFEYRSSNTNARNGAVVMFEGFQGTGNRGIHILDMTPASRTSSDAQDAVLGVGKEFKDKYGTAVFKTVAINANTWTEEGYVDLQITIPGTALAQFDRRTNLLEALRPGTAQAFDLMGRAWNGALPTRTLVIRDGKSLSMASGRTILQTSDTK